VPFIDANGVSLHYALAGQQGPSVVLLHELGGTMNSWNKVAPRLATRYRVLRYDQRGSGLSEKVRQEFSNDVLVEDFEGDDLEGRLQRGAGVGPGAAQHFGGDVRDPDAVVLVEDCADDFPDVDCVCHASFPFTLMDGGSARSART